MNKTNFPTDNLITRYCKNILILIMFIASTACSQFEKKQQTLSEKNNSPVAINLSSQCLLPSKIRKLSRNFTYLAPGSIIKTSQNDCHTRGGKIISKI